MRIIKLKLFFILGALLFVIQAYGQEEQELIQILKNRPLDLGVLYYFKDQPNYKIMNSRLRAINYIKKHNPQCYISLAKERLMPADSAVTRILAMERNDNPRPLVFETDADWAEFQQDLKKAFIEFGGPESNSVLLGSATTFFSESPVKGENWALRTDYPDCLDPETKENIYTFDTPGYDKSDIDIHIFSPELSKLCHVALENKPDTFKFNGGNDGSRPVYGENLFNFCLRASKNPAIKNMVKYVNPKKFLEKNGIINSAKSLMASLRPNTALYDFYKKWNEKLGKDRPINLSVRVLPAYLKSPSGIPGKMNFEGEPMLKKRFVTPWN